MAVCAGRVAAVELTPATYVREVSRDNVPWLVLFHGKATLDRELKRAVAKVGEEVEESQLHVGAVDCDTNDEFCRFAFGITQLPVMVLFHSGAWSVGTTFVFTMPRNEFNANDELHTNYLRDFALGNYKLKAVEYEPYRLRYDPDDSVSRFIWRLRSYGPSFSFQQLGELWQLRKNAVLVIFGGAFVVGFVVQKIIFGCF